jgi:hypothetical protein
MKNKTLLILSFCFMLIGGLATSCTEEEIEPTWKEGNVTGDDDWEKHNV